MSSPLQRRRHRSPLRPGSGQAPPRHVHRHHAPEPPGAGSHRQRGRRGAGRPRRHDRGHAARRRQLRGLRRRPRHAGRHPPGGEDPRRRTDPHPAARRRQVQQQELHLLRRPARRRRQRGQRAVERRSRCSSSATATNTGWPSRDGDRASTLEVVGSVGKKNTGTRLRFWPDPKYFDTPKFNLRALQAPAARQGRAVPGPDRAPARRGQRRARRMALRGRPARLPAGRAGRHASCCRRSCSSAR